MSLLSALLPLLALVQAEPAPPARALLQELTAQPRLAGTVGSLVGAEIVAKHLRAAGWQVEIDEREVLLSLPRRIELEIFDGAKTDAVHRRLERFDPDAIPPGDVPPCNGWSASGEVRAEVVDVGQGLRADFERLKAAGVDVRGKIALARYGGAYRGIKVDLATQFGCVAVLLFHERRSDGEAWPEGPWKPGHEAERGSISPMGRTPGDPSTPGWPSPKPGLKARRIAGDELASALPTIPCIPIGWKEAEILQAHLTSRETTLADGKTLAKPIGPGPAVARVLVDQPRDLRTIRNVIATLPGASEDCVIAGNHRDAWVRGANDAGSGTVALLRAAQHLSARVQAGWKPACGIKLGFWDAEEFGLVGSTEWAEAHARWIEEHVVAYLNGDVVVSGTHFRGVDGTPGMLAVLRAALERVETPLPRAEGAPGNLWEDWEAARKGKPAEIGLAGSGSDFAVFLHHLAVPTLDIGLGGNRGGQYHTAFDDFTMVERHLDPGFVGHELAGRLFTELLVEISTRGRESFDAREAAATLARHARAATWLEEGARERLAAGLEALGVAEGPPSGFYRRLARAEGIKGREWYKNPLWTPGLEDGYGSESFPLLRAELARGRDALAASLDAFLARLGAHSAGADTLRPKAAK